VRQIVNTKRTIHSGWCAKAGKRSAILASLGMLMLGSVFMSGCTWDSFMDPSIVGRWERTPTSVPILNHIGAIEDPSSS